MVSFAIFFKVVIRHLSTTIRLEYENDCEYEFYVLSSRTSKIYAVMFGKIHVFPILRSVAYWFPILILQISHTLFSPSRIAEPFSSEVLSQKRNLNSHMYLNLLCKKAFITLNTLVTFTFFFPFRYEPFFITSAKSGVTWHVGHRIVDS